MDEPPKIPLNKIPISHLFAVTNFQKMKVGSPWAINPVISGSMTTLWDLIQWINRLIGS